MAPTNPMSAVLPPLAAMNGNPMGLEAHADLVVRVPDGRKVACYVGAGAASARFVLAWTDYPGTLGASKALVNDLDLQVTAPDGTVYRGDGFGFRIPPPPVSWEQIGVSHAALAFRDLEAPLYGYLVLFLSTKVIDMILEGWSFSKLVIITSTRTDEIAEYILHGLDRSGTALRSRSLYLNREGELILTVIHRKQLTDLREFVRDIDPEAFVIINDTYDVLGKGFKSHLIT